MIPLPQKRVGLASGIELDTVDLGPPDAPALVFLHGFPESHRTWRNQIAHFSDRYRCIAPDQRGYRGSSKPQDVASYTADKLIGDVFELADALDVGSFVVVGHDWGGAIAWGVAIAGQFTGRVRAAIIANAPHPALFQKLLWTDREQRAASQYIRTLRDHQHDAMVEEHGLGALLLEAFGGAGFRMPEPEEAAALLDDWQDSAAALAMLNWYRASSLDVPLPGHPLTAPHDPAASFPRLDIPALVVWGMDDVALLPSNLEGLDALVPDLTVAQVPGSGHFVPWEAPDAVNRAMSAFLDRVTPA